MQRASIAVALLLLAACTRHKGDDAPRADFIIAAGDSMYWVENRGPGIKLRGSPLVLARLDNRFLELYVVDEDRSFENALFVGQRLYQRDLVTGDSTELFRDTLVMGLAEAFERRNPEARRLEPDEDPGEEPAVTASAELTVLAVHGPFLSVEYHVDTAGAGNESWHMTRHTVIDLRTARQATLADVLGPDAAALVLTRARNLFQETIDSVRRDRRPEARRAARSLNQFRFDPTSFSLTAPNGTLMIAFSAPGRGSGGEGFVLPLRPLPVTEPAWWQDARVALPSTTREREEFWARPGYTVKAAYDSVTQPARLSLVDSAGREFPIGAVTPPVHRIYWLDRPAVDRLQRSALTRAFDEAAMYDDAARTAHSSAATLPTWIVSSR